MAYSAVVTTTSRQIIPVPGAFIAPTSIAVTTGTYPTGGIGPIGALAAYGVSAFNTTPIQTVANSVGHPPSGIIYQYDPTTDKLRAMVQGAAAGDALAEFSGSIPADVIQVTQIFER